MDYIKSFIGTLVTTVILFSAIELISPNNSMKKYIKFVLGLILIIVMLNPILDFFTNGEEKIVSTIKEYENVLSYTSSSEEDNISTSEVEDVFIDNLKKNCITELKENFPDYDFICDIDCSVDFDNVNYEIKKIRIGISSNKIKDVKKIEKVEIASETKEETEVDYTEDENAIVKFTSNMLEISNDKIEVYTVS